MRRHELWIVSCTVLWLSACSTLPRPVVLDNENPARKEAAVRTRWVGVTKFLTRSCPVPGTPGWTVRPLFPLQGLDPKLRRSARNAKLHRFCVYEHTGEIPRSGKLELPRSISARLRSVEPDRVALSGMADLGEITPDFFSQRFSEKVQIPDNLPVQGTSKVRLVFLDTQPTGEGIPATSGLSPHGYTLTHIAGHLAGPLICENGSNDPCAVQVASRLALPLVSFHPWQGVVEKNMSSGGFRGTFVDLSDALWAEITAWQPTVAQPHMVLNLSAGWDGEKLGGWEEEKAQMPEAVRAVYGALETAATQGILVIAAAGNERGGPDPTGQPLLPGGWEKPYRRSELGVWGWKSPGQPLVYAASGVDGQGRPLVNTREKGEASRVAYADHVVVPDLYEPNQHTAILTGTSAAAAVVSTIAAVVWSYRPELTPAQVMAILSESGESEPRKHDFSEPTDPPVPDVQRITLCQALSEAWSTSQPPGPSLDCGGSLESNQDPFNTFDAPEMDSNQTLAFPATQHADLRDDPWIGPQPAMDPCPSCAVDPDGGTAFFLAPPAEIAVVADASLRSLQDTTPPVYASKLLIEIPNDWAAGDLKQATLEIFGFHPVTGRKVRLDGYSISADSLNGGNQAVVTFEQPSEPFQAALSFILNPPEGAPEGTTRSVISPLFVNDED